MEPNTIEAADVHITVPKGGRRRGGRRWPEGTTIVDRAEISDETLAALEGDSAFSIQIIAGTRPTPGASPGQEGGGDPSPSSPGAGEPERSEEEIDAITRDAIRELPASAFGTNGKPKLEPIRALLIPEVAEHVDALVRDKAWDGLVAGGFTAPVETPA